MRYQGKITSWKDDQGFGFISPNGGGPQVFVHVKSLSNRRRRPEGNEIVTYELAVNGKGQHRAENVAFVDERARNQHSRSESRSRIPLAIAPGFLGLLAILVLAGRLPASVFGLYCVAGLAAFIAYGLDKSAARNQRWRTKESTLHLLALFGGWPGALLAQRVLRHKSRKASFQTVFWGTVVVNCGALGWLLTPAGVVALHSVGLS